MWHIIQVWGMAKLLNNYKLWSSHAKPFFSEILVDARCVIKYKTQPAEVFPKLIKNINQIITTNMFIWEE